MCARHDLVVLSVQVPVIKIFMMVQCLEFPSMNQMKCNFVVFLGLLSFFNVLSRTSCTVYAVLLCHIPMSLVCRYLFGTLELSGQVAPIGLDRSSLGYDHGAGHARCRFVLCSGLSTGPEQHTFHPDADGSNFKARWNNGGRERFSTLSKDGGRCCASGVRDQDDSGKNQRTSASSTKYSRKEQPQDDVPKTLRQLGHHRSSARGRGAKIQRGGATPQRWSLGGHGHCSGRRGRGQRPETFAQCTCRTWTDGGISAEWQGALVEKGWRGHAVSTAHLHRSCISRWVEAASTFDSLESHMAFSPPPTWSVAERRSSTPTGTTWPPGWSGGYG